MGKKIISYFLNTSFFKYEKPKTFRGILEETTLLSDKKLDIMRFSPFSAFFNPKFDKSFYILMFSTTWTRTYIYTKEKISPSLTIYKTNIFSFFSIFLRISGMVMFFFFMIASFYSFNFFYFFNNIFIFIFLCLFHYILFFLFPLILFFFIIFFKLFIFIVFFHVIYGYMHYFPLKFSINDFVINLRTLLLFILIYYFLFFILKIIYFSTGIIINQFLFDSFNNIYFFFKDLTIIKIKNFISNIPSNIDFIFIEFIGLFRRFSTYALYDIIKS